jgi:hypothetical protein
MKLSPYALHAPTGAAGVRITVVVAQSKIVPGTLMPTLLAALN